VSISWATGGEWNRRRLFSTEFPNKKDNAKDREEHQPAHLQSEFAHGDQFDQTEPSLTIGLNALHARNAANFNAADIKLTPNPLPISPWRAG